MNLLIERIIRDGKVLDGNVLKVDSFINHQIDTKLLNEIGKEFKKRFQHKKINKILTIESSGIAIACIAAQYFNVPVVFAKKHEGINMDKNSYETEVYSFTKQKKYKVKVSKKFLDKNDKVLIIDDFLAKGYAVKGLIEIVAAAGAETQGVGIVIEKYFQGGRNIVVEKGIQLESLAVIESMENGNINFKS